MPLNPRSIHNIPWFFYIPSALQGGKKKGKKRENMVMKRRSRMMA